MNLLEIIEKAGVVGCGGAGFPTHIKWNAKAEHLIINAVECEPLLATDKFLMRKKPDDIIKACIAVGEQLSAKNITIAVKGVYRAEIDALKAAIERNGADIKIHEFMSFYPAGDEQVIVYEVTGKTVPCGGIPLDVGTVVSNVATMVAAFDALNGQPLIYKYVTVAGEVKNPTVIKVPIGTLVSECIEAAGGTTIDNPLIIVGGPMMGKDLSKEKTDNQRVTKTTSGILVIPRGSYMEKSKSELNLVEHHKKAATACIQCSYCTMLCPRHLLGHPLEPHKIMRALAHSTDIDYLINNNESVKNALLCSLCGVCSSYSCPMGLEPSKVNAILKEEMGKKGIRRSSKETTRPLSDREWRKVPTARLTSRIGVMNYEHKVGDSLIEIEPKEVSIALRQGPGKLAEPVVKVGDIVTKGMEIAAIPDRAMGNNIHSSIEGQVIEVSDVIRIRR